MIEKDETGTEAEGLLPAQDLMTGLSEAEEAIEEIGIETTTEETVIETDTMMRIDAEAEELAPEISTSHILQGHMTEAVPDPDTPEEEAVTEEMIENPEEKDLDPDLEATADIRQETTQKDLEAPVPTSAVKEIKTVPKEKTTITPPASTKEIVNSLQDPEIKVTPTKTITKIKAESLLRTKTKTTSE